PSPAYGRAAARDAIKSYLARHSAPEAIFCMNDDMAIGCYRGLCDLGLRVPRDVALVGCDGIEHTEYLETPLTTIVQPLDDMSRAAWQLLERRLGDPGAPPQRVKLSARLAVRESSRREN
ncbi:MAG TPA: substrate-binding domain-containing protein, partial [Armatimonadota bacterium]|nr:substrate-binding domain-containing protein [Armatimonadota bacterium]